jgi:uncharacterized small protein (DUF1192 family)
MHFANERTSENTSSCAYAGVAATNGAGPRKARETTTGVRTLLEHGQTTRPGHISEDESAVYAADLKNQVENLRLLIAAVEADLTQKQQSRLAAKSTEAWLLTLRERIAEVEEDTEEAFEKRRQLVKLLVERIDVGRDEYGETQVHITYRFGPPETSLEADISDGIKCSAPL